MSKSPKRKASSGPKRNPVTIEMEAEKKLAEQAKSTTSKTATRSTPRVGRDANKPEPNSQPPKETKPDPKPQVKEEFSFTA